MGARSPGKGARSPPMSKGDQEPLCIIKCTVMYAVSVRAVLLTFWPKWTLVKVKVLR